ncbi:MAG: tetratricopeptide repeat protein [Acidobacteria bacterium]|nr:tetratricopeptide repeat protein [Acidobacteriota bacterium]
MVTASTLRNVYSLAFCLFVLVSSIKANATRLNAVTQLPNRNQISGVITDTEGKPLDRIRVELADEVEMTITQTYTTSNGRYSFRNLTSGTFIVKVHSDGKHAATRARVNIYSIRNGSSSQEQVDFTLKTLAETKGSSVPSNTGTTFAQEVPADARKLYERATRQLDNKQIEQGIASLKEAIVAFPTYFQALERLGIEHARRQEYEPALEALAKAAKINPNGAACLYVLGVAQYYLGHLPPAADSLRRAVLIAPGSPNATFAHFYLGLALWRLSRHADAEPHLRKSLELGGNSIPADVHLYLAQQCSDTQRYKEAADELEIFLKLAPDVRDAENIRNLIRKLRAKTQQTNLQP